MKIFIQVCHLFIFCTVSLSQVIEISLPQKEPVELEAYARITSSQIQEASGLVKSRLWPDVYWTHNDSGDQPRIFAINRTGELIKPDWMPFDTGIQIPDAVHVDWESITTDDSGNLIIGDCGNNSNTRRDLSLYFVKEPYPSETANTTITRKIFFSYPDLEKIPPTRMNFDAEGIFWYKKHIYILTKHRSDTFTKLYRLDTLDPTIENTLTFISRFNIQGKVTGADISEDYNQMVILTDNSVWLFKTDGKTDNFFLGKKFWLPILIKGGEAICFDNNYLLICNEAGELFQLSIGDMIPLND